jgi:3-oxoacyl-[acyl-carrier-protein] synthase-1
MGFFSKKEVIAPAPAAPRAKTASKSAPIAITGLGLACLAGDQPYELISSMLGQISGTELSDEYKIMSDDGTYLVPRMAPVPSFGDIPERERMYQLTTNALSTAAAQISPSLEPESVLIVIMVAPEFVTRFKKVDTLHLQSYLTEKTPRLESSTFRILPNNTGSSTGVLRAAIAELNEGKWQAVIFGGADSLISIFTCQDLHSDDRLNVVGSTEGVVPGEGAAFVVLQSTETANANTSPPLGYLRGLGVEAEPNARDADLAATEGLSIAINQALTQADIAATDIQGIVHNLGAETVHAIEWYQTSKKIWPRRINEQQRVAVQLGEIEQADTPDDPIPKIILPYMTMGEVGAAALPMHLATALAWMEFDAHQARWGFPVRKHLLVCDTPDTPERGALIISTTLATAT